MQGADYIIAGVVVLSVVWGALRGFVREIVALASWVIGIWIAWRFSGFLHPYLGGLLDSPAQKAWAARVIVLLAVLLLGNLTGALLGWIMHTAAGLGMMDRLLGSLFGLCRGAVIVGFAAMVGRALQLDNEPWWTQARLMPYVEAAEHSLEAVSGHHPEVRHRFELPAVSGEH